MKGFLAFLVLILLAALGYGGWLFFQKNEELDQTRLTLNGLNDNLVSLQTQLSDEQANAAAIQGQLASERARASTLQNELGGAQGQISSYNSRNTALQAELDASKARILSLESELAAADALISSTQVEIAAELARLNIELTRINAELATANTDLIELKTVNESQLAELKKVKDPRHFYSIEELQAWLLRDDTNTNSAFASLGLADKAFVLQVRALRDGYLLPAALDADSQHIYSWNIAVIGAGIYVVTAGTDEALFLSNFEVPPAQRPLPLP